MNDSEFLDEQESSIDILKEIRYYLFFWPIYVLSLILFLSFTYIYLRYQPRIYSSLAAIQITDSKSDPSNFLVQSQSPMFYWDTSTLDNEIAIIKSNRILSQVVDTLNLHVKTYQKGRFKNSLKYAEEIPFQINFLTPITISVDITLDTNSSVISYSDPKTNTQKTFTTSNSDLLVTPYFEYKRNDNVSVEKMSYLTINKKRESIIKQLQSNLSISNSASDILDFTINGTNIKENEAILECLINVLKADQVKDKREVYKVSIDFINERLSNLEFTLDTMNLKTVDFQAKNDLYSSELQTKNALDNILKSEEISVGLNIKIQLAQTAISFIKKDDINTLLPSFMELENTSISDLVLEYNNIFLNRQKLLLTSTTQNPIVQELYSNLISIKNNIISSLENYIIAQRQKLQAFELVQNQFQVEAENIPGKQVIFNAFARNLQISESLYLFLLQKKEQASISYIAALPNIKLINYTTSRPAPISPNPTTLYYISVFCSIALPVLILFLLKFFDTKIYDLQLLKKLIPNIPVLGEIPILVDQSKKTLTTFTESLRIVRSNLNFVLPKNKTSVILITSCIKGEGKTFSAYNISKIYQTLNDKKVLLIGADLRNPQIHNMLNLSRPTYGLSTYLSDPNANSIDKIITKTENNNFDLLLSGTIPPNPSELLLRDVFKDLLDQLSLKYDFIFIDTAPLMLVSDTLPLVKYCDALICVYKANYSQKKQTEFFNNFISNNNIKNVSILFNGVNIGPSSYYKYGYAYRYSYQYNYGYGYGYEKD